MWTTVERPGYFGRKRDERVAELNKRFGEGKWRLAWILDEKPSGWQSYDFFNACRFLYEESYYRYLSERQLDAAFLCSYGECYDNAVTNIQSGLDYMRQEAYSTHIQDIAVRNVLRRLGRWFTGPPDKLLQIRSKDSNGYLFGPGNVPFFDAGLVGKPSLCPSWAKEGSVEDFWQSNKWVQVWSE